LLVVAKENGARNKTQPASNQQNQPPPEQAFKSQIPSPFWDGPALPSQSILLAAAFGS